MKKTIIITGALCAMLCTNVYAQVPVGISVEGYDPNANYLDLMLDAAQDGSSHAMVAGSIYEAQRNLKIEKTGANYTATHFFDNGASGQEVVTAIKCYTAPAHALTKHYTEADVTMLAKVMYAEARGIKSQTEKSAICWCILNRYDAGYAKTIAGVVTAPYQFAYSSNLPTVDDYGNDLCALARDVLERWNDEVELGIVNGRTLPRGYCWYSGNGSHNIYRNAYQGGSRWGYSLPSPYDS